MGFFFSLYQVRLLEVATWNIKLRLSEAEVGRKVYHHLLDVFNLSGTCVSHYLPLKQK